MLDRLEDFKIMAERQKIDLELNESLGSMDEDADEEAKMNNSD